jgi:hypothetical protein
MHGLPSARGKPTWVEEHSGAYDYKTIEIPTGYVRDSDSEYQWEEADRTEIPNYMQAVSLRDQETIW